ncbi:patatin-like phospholipase family protein [Thiothrix sp.]|uniref:patatin-like phospholipase family protein n=1 Tax=Thiothrix sp. TaxID=1032 RepID=UPI0025797D7E|nr:patatin-like phospholipase family protein [Thiothrix sp.]
MTVFSLLLCFSLPTSEALARPKIGLVLGGGGAAGIAHVGVLKVLEANHIPVDVIAGNSMGAVVGSLYASGMSVAEIEQVSKTLDWVKLFSDDTSHQLKSYQQKQQNADFFTVFESGVSKRGIKLSSGLIDGQKLIFELRRLLAPVAQISNFDRLPIPFRAVATDIHTGDAVVLKQGNLASAVRASMSIPGLFAPVTLDNRLLVDGLVSNNLPVDIARQMGADILIVSNIPPDNSRKLDTALDISLQSMDLLVRKTSEAQLASLTPQDILIQPPVGEVGRLDFTRVAETVALGEKGARTQLAALQRLASSLGSDANQFATPAHPIDEVVKVASVQIENDSSLRESILRKALNIKPGDVLDNQRLQDGLNRVYTLGYFSLVDYTLTQLPSGDYGLKVIAKKATEGEHRVSVGFSLGDDFNGDTRYQAGVKYVQKGLTDSGTELRAQAVIGRRLLAEAEIYHPLGIDGTFVAPRAWYQERDANSLDNTQQVANIRAREARVQVDIGHPVGNSGEIRAGVFNQKTKPLPKDGTPVVADKTLTEAGVKLQYQADTLDSINFPTKGGQLTAAYTRGVTAMGSDNNFNRIELEADRVWSVHDKHRFIASGRAVATAKNGAAVLDSGNNLETHALQTGHLVFSDNAPLIGNETVAGSVTYMRQVAEIPEIAKVHVGASVGVSQAWQQRDAVDLGGLRIRVRFLLVAKRPLALRLSGCARRKGLTIKRISS